MTPFAPRDSNVIPRHMPRRREDAEEEIEILRASAAPRLVSGNTAGSPVVALRRFRVPVPVRVRVEDGRPVRVEPGRGVSGGRVAVAAGPWRTSGAWWEPQNWDRDEWDVSLSDGVTYRLFRERERARWFVEGVVD